jgi:asparagine synthase (glutamine-hydrolysing)
MCGISGLIHFDGAPVDRGAVRRMTDALAHRGPDDDGYFVDGPVGLGHRRLSIIDLAGGKQPITNEDGSVVIVFNGEVYNYRELTQELVGKGHSFRTRSDTEAMVHAYEEYGDDCVHRFRGMFGFAIWDARERRALVARDRLGIKPIYYHVGEGFLAFASEVKALLERPEVPREMDEEALSQYLTLRYVPGPRTMFRGIRKLQPGHRLVCERGRVRVERYWDLAFSEGTKRSDAAYLEEFERLLDESVRLRMIAEVPVGVFLSGGIDSSAILAKMAQNTSGHRVQSFAVGYSAATPTAAAHNEFAYARMAADALGADHHEYRVTAEQFRDFVPDLVYKLDEPLADSSCIPLYFLSRLAREHITVVLSGEGSDEILGGYGIYQRMTLLDGLYRRAPALAAKWAPRLAAFAPNEISRRYLRLLGQPLEQGYRGVSKGVAGEVLARLRPGAPASSPTLDALFEGYYETVRDASALNRMLYTDTKVWLADDLLLKADKITMANALELRVPFLDHKLVEFAASLPTHLKIKGGTGKVLLRRAMRGVLPAAIIDRPKKGFPTPTREWFRGPLAGFAREVLLDGQAACGTHFDRRAVETILDEHRQGSGHWEQEIWTLLVFEHWWRAFMSAPRPARRHDAADEAAVAARGRS